MVRVIHPALYMRNAWFRLRVWILGVPVEAVVVGVVPFSPCHSTREGRVAFVWRRESSVAHVRPTKKMYFVMLRLFIVKVWL